MVISSPKVFHSLLCSDCNTAIRGTTIKEEMNLWEKGPISLVRGVFFFPWRVEGEKWWNHGAQAQEILAVVQGSVSA